jgi:hypothetical protein
LTGVGYGARKGRKSLIALMTVSTMFTPPI